MCLESRHSPGISRLIIMLSAFKALNARALFYRTFYKLFEFGIEILQFYIHLKDRRHSF